MQEFGVCSNCPRDRAAEEISLGRSNQVDILLVLLRCAFRQMEFQLIAVLEHFVDDQGVLTNDWYASILTASPESRSPSIASFKPSNAWYMA